MSWVDQKLYIYYSYLQFIWTLFTKQSQSYRSPDEQVSFFSFWWSIKSLHFFFYLRNMKMKIKNRDKKSETEWNEALPVFSAEVFLVHSVLFMTFFCTPPENFSFFIYETKGTKVSPVFFLLKSFSSDKKRDSMGLIRLLLLWGLLVSIWCEDEDAAYVSPGIKCLDLY